MYPLTKHQSNHLEELEHIWGSSPNIILRDPLTNVCIVMWAGCGYYLRPVKLPPRKMEVVE